MQSKLSGSGQNANIFSRPQQLLSVIFNALEDEHPSTNVIGSGSQPCAMNLDRLKIVSSNEARDDFGTEVDSDDEPEDGAESADVNLPSSIASTAVTLLLSLLEGDENTLRGDESDVFAAHPDLSTVNNPILDMIWDQIQTLTRGEDCELAVLAREARLVLSARLATGSTPTEKNTADAIRSTEKEKYQRALKLLQDPILPIRAHGLVLLKEIVSPPPSSVVGAASRSIVDTALIPAIKNIFIDFIQDDDTYLFLNAVQGLSALASHSGRETLSSVISIFNKGLEKRPVVQLTKQEIEIRLRVGEALSQVIDQLNEVLPAYGEYFADTVLRFINLLSGELLFAPLFNLVGERDAPVLIRISAISLLAHCVTINPNSVAPYRVDLVNSMLDLLQIESLHAQRQSLEGTAASDETDKFPQTTDSKVAEFRRAALHLLELLIKDAVSSYQFKEEQLYRPTSMPLTITKSTTRRVPHDADALGQETFTKIDAVLGYISATDVDAVVRLMAKESLEMMHSN